MKTVEAARAAGAKWRAAHPEASHARHAAYYAANKDKYRAWGAKYREAHPDEVLTRKGLYRDGHRQEARDYSNAYNAVHKEEIALRRAAHYLEHAAELRARTAAWSGANAEYAATYRATHTEERRSSGRAYNEAHPEVRVRAKYLRRAREAGLVEIEAIDLVAVAARDGWRCGLCGERVLPKARGPEGKSLDHIVPISRGGQHTMVNVQLAHFRCNAAKANRDRIASQMRMFG